MSSPTEEIEDVTVSRFTAASSVRWVNDTTPSSHLIGLGSLIFRSTVIVVAVVGSLANGAVLGVLCKSKQLKTQAVNILFVNQMSLDLFSCAAVIVTYSVWLADIYLTGTSGYLVCIFLLTDNSIWLGLYGSKVNLVSIAVERYVKIVHPIWHKNNFRPWMTGVAVAATWIIGATISFSMGTLTTVVIDGQCLWGAVWLSDGLKEFCGIFNFVLFFVLILVIFGFCYGKIIMVVRRQSRTFAVQHANNPLAKASNIQSLRIQMNAVKTMIIVSGAFVIFWLPLDCLSMITMVNDTISSVVDVYYTTLFAAYFNMCTNPFIYAVKYDLVKNYLMGMIHCRKRGVANSTTVNVIPLTPTIPTSSSNR